MSNNTLELEIIKQQIAHYCAFSLGKQYILELEPQFNKLVIKQELSYTKDALDLTYKYGSMPFDGIKDITKPLNTAKKDGICNEMDLLYIADHNRSVKQMLHYITNVDLKVENIKELISCLKNDDNLQNQIEKTISINGEVLDSASSKLRSIRSQLRSIDGEIIGVANKFISQNSKKLMDTIVTSRNNRYVVLSKVSEKNSFNGIIHGESTSGQSTYVEPSILIPLNNKKQSLVFEEVAELEKILFELSQLVKYSADDFLANLETITLLDSYFARANWGKKYEGCCASLSDEPILKLKNARHPLIDQKVVVSNNYNILNDQRILLITGPNTGGKSVALKTIGLFTLLTYCAIPVSCDSALIPFFDKVFVDIGDDQSIVQSLSTFSAHLSKIAYITSNATKNSLILVDEIGSGTDPVEGEALAIAILEDIRQIGCMCAATTHFSGCKKYGKANDDILIASVQFDVEKMQPTFRYIEGSSGMSNAIEIAKRYNIKPSIIDYALQIRENSRSNEDILIEKLEIQILENQKQAQIIEAELLKNRSLNDELIKQINDVQTNREKIMEKAKVEASDYVNSIKDQADEMLISLDDKKEEIKLHEVNKFFKSIEKIVEIEKLEVVNKTIINVDDYVTMKNSNQMGKVISINKNNVQVDLNGMRINTKMENLKYAKKPTTPVKKTVRRRVDATFDKSFSIECNLIGERVYEALEIMDKYLDDAIVANASFVRIIHGAGSGALRKGVHENLSRRKNLTFRLGSQGEGGVGATVVSFVSKK